MADAIPSGGGFLGRRGHLLAGGIRVGPRRPRVLDGGDGLEAGPSPRLRHRLGRRALGHLHRRHHHVQVSCGRCAVLLLVGNFDVFRVVTREE